MKVNALTSALFAAASCAGVVSAEPIPAHHRRQADLEDFIAAQSEIAIDGVLANIGADGSRAPGVPAGIVIASPSREDPDYWYTWTRDASLTYKALIERFIAGDSSLQTKIDEFVSSQAELQTVSNPSGTEETGGLGEPKFNVDLTAFTGPWGRPQRDGPSLRASALTIYANWLIANGQQSKAQDEVWPVIAKDLQYTVRFWNQTGYDLWEEVSGSSFFTLASNYRSLVEGALLADALGQSCEGCAESAPQVLCFLESSFWVSNGGYIDSNVNVNEGRSGKDANSLLTAMHLFDPEAECTDATFQPCSSRALSNHKAVVDSFRTEYSINRDIPQGRAVAVGRYSEDVYFEGNPWYLTTLAAAEQLFAALIQWDTIGSITVDDVSLAFFRDLIPSIATGDYASGSETYESIVSAVKTYADDFIAVVQQYTPSDGSLTEQYDRNSGEPLAATHLTWSYAAFLTTIERREGIAAPSWGEPAANDVPGVCTSPPACNSRTTFNVRVRTSPGEDVFVVGALTQLGNWAPGDAVALSADRYSDSDPLWFAAVELPAETAFDYKYIIKQGGNVRWESDPNRRLTTSAGCDSQGSVSDTWR